MKARIARQEMPGNLGMTTESETMRHVPILAAMLVVLSAAGCSSLPPSPTATPAARDHGAVPDPLRAQVVFTAMQQVGVPYRWGGNTPRGFDCSGLVEFAFRNAGLSVPRTAEDQRRAARPVRLEDALAGDLLFFRESGRTTHVAIYLGDGRFVHAPSSGKTVSLESLANSHWRARLAGAGRPPALGAG